MAKGRGGPKYSKTDHTIRLKEDLLVIDVSSELTEALRESAQASIRVLKAANSANREQHREATKEWLAAQRRRRAAWLAMATPLPAG
jgi:hypothetical protein